MRYLSRENEFCMQFHFHANQSHFRNGFALRLALKQRHKGTRKWPIYERTFLSELNKNHAVSNELSNVDHYRVL